MSLQAILEAIQANGEVRLREIELQAQTQANAVLVNAQEQAGLARESARASVLAPAVAERARILHSARLEALRIVGGVREALVDTALERTRGRLLYIRTEPDYPIALRCLAEEALAGVGGSPEEVSRAQIDADPRDRHLLERILSDMGLDLQVRYVLDCWGGLIAKSEDGRIVVINTLEARLERATPALRHHLAVLIEGQTSETNRLRDEVVLETYRKSD